MFRLFLLFTTAFLIVFGSSAQKFKTVSHWDGDFHEKYQALVWKKPRVERKQGKYQKFFHTALIESGQYESDMKVGKWKQFNKDGSLKSISNYTNGKLDGKHFEYHAPPNHFNLSLEGSFKNGNRVGLWKIYSQDGTLYARNNFDSKHAEILNDKPLTINGVLNQVPNGDYKNFLIVDKEVTVTYISNPSDSLNFWQELNRTLKLSNAAFVFENGGYCLLTASFDEEGRWLDISVSNCSNDVFEGNLKSAYKELQSKQENNRLVFNPVSINGTNVPVHSMVLMQYWRFN